MENEDILAKRSDTHYQRRLWHVTCGAVALVLYAVLNYELIYWGYFAITVALSGFFLDFRRFKDPELNQKLSKMFGPIMRKSEKISFSGLPFYALGSGLSIFLYEEEIAILSILFLVFADPIASVVGVRMGRDRLLPNKTLQGTVAAFVTCLIISIGYLIYFNNQSPNLIIFAFFASIVGALSEMLGAFNIDDNLIIPVLSGGAMTALNHWLLVF